MSAVALESDGTVSLKVIPTGSEKLNDLIGVGGWPIGRISEVHGSPGCGATLLAMMTSLEAVRSGHTVLYLDMDQGVTPDMMGELNGNSKFLRVNAGFLESCRISMAAMEAGVKLVVVDSVANYDLRLSGMGVNGQELEIVSDAAPIEGPSEPKVKDRELLLQLLLNGAQKYQCAVLVIQSLRNPQNEDVIPLLRYRPSLRVKLIQKSGFEADPGGMVTTFKVVKNTIVHKALNSEDIPLRVV